MKKIFFSILVLLLSAFWTAQAVARCAYYGPPYNAYRCMPDKPGTPKATRRGGGTGGKVFKKMEENEKECGYFDPGCQRQKRNQPAPEEDEPEPEEHEYEED